MLPLNLYARVRVFCALLHTRPRVQRAPGLPCALCFKGAELPANLGLFGPRERGVISFKGGGARRAATDHILEGDKSPLSVWAIWMNDA